MPQVNQTNQTIGMRYADKSGCGRIWEDMGGMLYVNLGTPLPSGHLPFVLWKIFQNHG
jgi:hypothetical protein